MASGLSAARVGVIQYTTVSRQMNNTVVNGSTATCSAITVSKTIIDGTGSGR